MKNLFKSLVVAAGMALAVGCGGGMEAEEATPATPDERGVTQEALPVCGSGLDCRGYSVSGSSACIQTPTSTRAVYCCPNGQRVYHNDAGQEFCA
ncbi:hypothetical protein D7V97_38660 [Corallococcus sp. CA053C]|uniref:hypothetical protein n=1 Tax=Corallococcus sp. CA053C TaxID=2316732 RepID=UPI000EA059DA|nr:hypothetical protein [Corallococcus sp. CA053C]RKG94550.1 hypothetical protein D7V97_38660 [Corallococcus sp. CA053C]